MTVVDQPLQPTTADPAANLPPHVVLSHTAGRAIDGLVTTWCTHWPRMCVCARYLDGDMLWRRFVGIRHHPAAAATGHRHASLRCNRGRSTAPRSHAIGGQDGKDVVASHARGTVLPTVIVADHPLRCRCSGKLYVVDIASGQAPRYLQFPQPLEVATCRSTRHRCSIRSPNRITCMCCRRYTRMPRSVQSGTRTRYGERAARHGLGYLFVVENAGPRILLPARHCHR